MTNDDDKADVIDISAQVMGVEFSDNDRYILTHYLMRIRS